MARYYEETALIEIVKQYTPHINGETTLECVGRAIREAPPADVVPKSEVDRLKRAYEGSQNTIKGLTEMIREKNKELAKLETHLELHYGQRSLNNLIAEEKAEVAIEILREIDNALSKFYCYEYGMVRRYIPPLLIELKNKYAEGNYDRT